MDLPILVGPPTKFKKKTKDLLKKWFYFSRSFSRFWVIRKPMYTPESYKVQRTDLIEKVISDHGFATIITMENGEPLVSHLPLMLEELDGKQSLIGHCARANPQWKHFAQELTAIFHGPHSYISPAWYAPKPDNVPTWNYVTVHVRGKAEILSEPRTAYEVLAKTVKKFEMEYQTGWELPEHPNAELGALLKGIVAFRIEIKNIDAKFKLSQMQNATNRKGVIDALPKFGEMGLALAEYMKKF